MTILLNNISKLVKEGKLDDSQALFLIYTYNNIPYIINTYSLAYLIKHKYMVNNRISKDLLTEVAEGRVLSGTMRPIYTTEISKDIPLLLCRKLCPRDASGDGIQFPGNEATIDTTISRFLGGEGLIAYHYMIFLYIFPVQGEKNKMWERQFTGNQYKGAKIRTRTLSSAQSFKKVVKKLDMGIFLYGTFLFMQSCIHEGKPFVKTIKNYFLEYEDWYEEAKELVSKAKTAEDLFKKTSTSDSLMRAF